MELKKFLIRIVVKMLASTFFTFTLVFLTTAFIGLIMQLAPWLQRTGVIDIDPLTILVVSFSLAFATVCLRVLIMRRYSKIKI